MWRVVEQKEETEGGGGIQGLVAFHQIYICISSSPRRLSKKESDRKLFVAEMVEGKVVIILLLLLPSCGCGVLVNKADAPVGEIGYRHISSQEKQCPCRAGISSELLDRQHISLRSPEH
ncbi:hypothetical protein Tco_0497497 [Tanacetum coccineum]